MLVEIEAFGEGKANFLDWIEELIPKGDYIMQSSSVILMWEQDYENYKHELGCHRVMNFKNNSYGDYKGVDSALVGCYELGGDEDE